MKSSPKAILLGWALFAAAGCGRKGPLEMPRSRIPAPVENVTVTQRGDGAVVEWGHSGKNIDGHPPVEIEAVEIWAVFADLAGGGFPTLPADVEREGRRIVRLTARELAPLPATGDGSRWVALVPLGGARSAAAVRALSLRVQANGTKLSDFSKPVAFELRPCALPPSRPTAAMGESSIEIRWSPPPANVDGTTPPVVRGYRVYRSEDGRPPRLLTPEPVTDRRYEDGDVRYGSVLRYFLRTTSTAASPFLESADSEVIEIVPRDVFPPAPPDGLVGIADANSVSLSWRAGPESDLAGYRVWRRGEGSPDEVLLTPQPIVENVFLDASSLAGGVYVYSVSAVDQSGNESGRSRPAAVRLKKGER